MNSFSFIAVSFGHVGSCKFLFPHMHQCEFSDHNPLHHVVHLCTQSPVRASEKRVFGLCFICQIPACASPCCLSLSSMLPLARLLSDTHMHMHEHQTFAHKHKNVCTNTKRLHMHEHQTRTRVVQENPLCVTRARLGFHGCHAHAVSHGGKGRITHIHSPEQVKRTLFVPHTKTRTRTRALTIS